MVGSEFFLLLGTAAMNDSDVVIDTHARTHARKHTYTHRERKQNSEWRGDIEVSNTSLPSLGTLTL